MTPLDPAGFRPRLLGDPALLSRPLVALLASTRVPPDLFLPTFDHLLHLAATGAAFLSGFHSPLERDALEVLLGADAPVIVCPARAVDGLRLPRAWSRRIERGRMAVASPFHDRDARRVTAARAQLRTAFLLDHAHRLFVPAARPGSRTYTAAARALEQRLPTSTFRHPANHDLLVLGATPLDCDGDRPLPHRSAVLDGPRGPT